MPCTDGGPSRENIELERRRQRGLAVGLCIACKELERHGLLPPSLRSWLIAHENADTARDNLNRAKNTLYAARNAAKADFNELTISHPAYVAMQKAYGEKDMAESIERGESAKLSSLKPETTV